MTSSRRLHLVSETRLWLILAGVGFLLRLGLAYVSEGSNDIITWGMFAQSAHETGVYALYETFQTIPDSVFNHPPLMGFLGLLAWRVSQALALPFAFVFKLPMVLADGLTAFLLWRIWQKERGTNTAALTVAAFGWSWLAILVSAYHGNTDSLGAFLCLLAAYLLQEKRPAWGGLALAAALNVKLIPIALVVAFALRGQSWRGVFRFGVGLALGLLPFLSVVVCCGRLFYQNAIVYNSSPNLWGIVYFLMASQSNPALASVAQSLLDLYRPYARYLILELVALAGVWARFRGWSYYDLGAVSLALFLISTPGFGVQYLVWLCPLLFAASLRWAMLYSYLAGLFIGLIYYTHWDGTFPYHSLFDQYYPMPTPLIGLLVWMLLIQFVAGRLTRPQDDLTVCLVQTRMFKDAFMQNNPFKRLIQDFYTARRQQDEASIRRLLAEDVIWHEPPMNEVTGDLYGVEAVLRMMREALALTQGTFSLEIEDVLANQSHAVALIHWTAEKAGQRLIGSEFAVFRIEGERIKEVWFYQQDQRTDAAFWGVNTVN